MRRVRDRAAVDAVADRNYNADATDEDGSCTYAEDGYDCDGTAWQMLTETVYVMSSRLLAARIQRLATTTPTLRTRRFCTYAEAATTATATA